MINHTMVLTINGTRRSEKAGGLDDGEVSTFENKPGEYRVQLAVDFSLQGVIQPRLGNARNRHDFS